MDRFVNQAKSEDYESVALTLLALKQQGLLHNHLSVSKKSEFVKFLARRITRWYSEDAKFEAHLPVWRDLHVLDVLSSRVPELVQQANDLLLDVIQGENKNADLVGVAFSLLARQDSLPNWGEVFAPIMA